ncbi:MAG TPA: nuclear transport factor 2 family protein [Steroidobacteraceae bacterium]|jgi:ketosteroid isomerase-like protein|nr:nuclear transport factor 2 family protein [Steroidobacteraceae bacterium]
MIMFRLARHVALATTLACLVLLGGCVTTTTTTPAVGSPTKTITTATPTKAKAAQPKPADTSGANAVSIEASNALLATATRQVIAAEEAFAKTMADRNFKSFVTFLSQDAVFFSGTEVSRGPAAVAAKWETYFSGREAPFSWTPDHVEVLASGNLALSTGWVYQNHKPVGRFNSIWRLEAANTWRVVFDKGEAICGTTP